MSDIDDSIPSDFEAERAVLGSMMLSPGALADCAAILKAPDFARPSHQGIFAAIMAVSGRVRDADPIAVKVELERRGTLAKHGGADYLHTLIAAVPSVANAAWYAARVRDCAVRWRLAESATTIRDAALRGDIDLTARIDAAYKVLDEAAGLAAPPGAKSLGDLVTPVMQAIEAAPFRPQGVSTGWADFNEIIPGFRGGQMITVGARPAVGKSVILLNIAVHAGIELGIPVLVCTLEMPAQECVERILSARAHVDGRAIRSGSLTEQEWGRLGDAHPHLTACGNVMINDDPYMSLQGIRSDLRAMRRYGMPAGLVVVDYLGLMKGTGKTENREREVSEFSRGMKLMAKEFDVPTLVGSQLNRGPELRSDHRPMLADLRDSGSVEQDSDIVILLYRDEVYEKESPRAGEIDLIVAKNRQGPLGTATLAFRGRYSMCADMYRPSPAQRRDEEAA